MYSWSMMAKFVPITISLVSDTCNQLFIGVNINQILRDGVGTMKDL